jgi:hypothetical protein
MAQQREIESDFDDDEVSIVRPEVNALEAITRSEVAMQLDAAHRWPRSVTKFLKSATELACYNEEVAASCMYSIPRAGKMIEGKSIRLAEICASSWGNLHIGARVLDEDSNAPTITGQAVVWDLERNVRVTVEAARGILTSKGKRYEPDLIRTNGMAALSIAYRNAVFRVIPQAYANQVYGSARATAVGDATTLVAKREKWVSWLLKTGATPERIFARLGVAGINDVTLDHIATLIGLAQAIRTGDVDVDTAFPVVVVTAPAPAGAPNASGATGAAAAPPPPAAAAPEGRRVNVGPGKRGRAAPPGASGGEPPTQGPATVGRANTTGEKTAAKVASTAERIAAGNAAERARNVPGDLPVGPGVAPAIVATAPAAEAPTDPAALLEALARIDDTWKGAPDGAAIVATWNEAERREALTWAQAVLNNRPLAEQARRPPFTNIDEPPDDEAERQPGED